MSILYCSKSLRKPELVSNNIYTVTWRMVVGVGVDLGLGWIPGGKRELIKWGLKSGLGVNLLGLGRE